MKTPQIRALPGSAPLGISGTYTITIRGEQHHGEGPDAFQCLSETYCRLRDKSGEGASTFPSPNVRRGGKIVGHISYNGRVWQGSERDFDIRSGVLLYDNRVLP